MTIKKRNFDDIGDMTEQITIQEMASQRTDTGGFDKVYTNLDQFTDIWARVRDVRGTTTNAQGGKWLNNVNKEFTIFFHDYFKDNVGTPNLHILWNSRRYKIKDNKNVGEADRYLEFICDAMDFQVVT